MVYRLILSYVGTVYAGWQRQPNALSVQEVVETALESVLGSETTVVAAGRTDAGVHARGQVAHLELDRLTASGALVGGANHFLPHDVRVLGADRVRDGFHARKSARAKVYSYRVQVGDVLSPLDAPFVLGSDRHLDVERLRRAARSVVGEHDFTAFALAGGSHRQPMRHVYVADWHRVGESLELRIAGNGFLRGMVRSLVGTMLEVGQGRRSVADFERLLQGAPRSDAGPTAPAHGLTLEHVLYDPGWAFQEEEQ